MTPSEHISADRNQEGPSQPRASILMVDDHPSNLLALEAILEPLGQELVKATSGEEALKFLLQRDFAVILMDVQMPGLDGFQTATLIKQRERTRTIPIIFLTALSRDAAHVFKGYAHGAVDYLLKPFDPEILRSKVSVFVDLFLKEQQIQRQAALLREREREALERQSELRHLRLTESLPEVMWAARSDGSFTYANRAARDYTGIQAEQPLSLNTFLEFVHPSDREAMRAALERGLACLGICLGMQLLFEGSDEGEGAGLGYFAGRVTRLGARRVPEMGWNQVEGDRTLAGARLDTVYYAHSFVCRAEDSSVVTGWTTHEEDRFPAAVRRGRVVGVQFHPEKSSAAGVRFVQAFLQEVAS